MKNYVVCVNFGTKYGTEYIRNLYKMVEENCTIPYEFVCITDDPSKWGGNTFIPKESFEGWWNKLHLYRKDLPIKGNILYFDLDVVITNNIDKLFTFEPNRWCTLNDFIRKRRTMIPKDMYNSSVVRFKTGELSYVWEKFIENPTKNSKTPCGDQAFLHKHTIKNNPALFFPDEWIRSYRWDIKENGLGEETCAAIFHGTPNPVDKIVLEKEEWVKKALHL